MDCPDCSVSRRTFLKNGAIALAAFTVAPGFLQRAVAATPNSTRGKVLVTIFQRGAADGLSMVVPFGDPGYYAVRRTIAVPAPSGGQGDVALDLDGHFGLHPGLAALKPLYDQGHLAIVHASGSPSNSRSHFDAQDYMESGTPGLSSLNDGWLNRAMANKKSANTSPFRAVAISPGVPRSLRGDFPAIAMPDVESFSIKDRGNAVAAAGFESMYDGAVGDTLKGTGKETFGAIKMLKDRIKGNYQAANGAQYPKGRLGKSLSEIARLIKGDVGLEVAFTDVGGWDTHANQGGAKGQLATHLLDFAKSLAAFHQDLGDKMADVCVLTMTEFGRMVKENGSGGTDHGHASCNFILGGGVKGRKVYGQWPGLQQEQLYEGRDLAVTTDFRTIFSEVAGGFLQVPDTRVVFPNFTSPGSLGFLS